MAFPKAHLTLRYCGLLLIVFLQQHIVASSTLNYAELMKECDRDFCICINRNVDDAEQCPWDPDYFAPAGKVINTMYSSAFRFRICGLVDSPSRSDGSEISTRARVGDVNTTQFVFVNATVGTERAITMDDVDMAYQLYKINTTYFYGDERNESFSFTPFDLISCPSTIDTSTSLPTSTPSVAPSSSDSDGVRNDTLFGLMVLVIVNAFVIFGF
mmetsp:Transcript_35001/g.39084  ORF Transcript_35001/g.39084 Transcript_35001/m.39084 type:complete len:214 (-) Transcript_35001:90-731(-)